MEVNGNPQKWAQNCFYLCAYSVLVQVLIIILIPFALNGPRGGRGGVRSEPLLPSW